MATLIADRFLCDAGIVDLATGEFVDLRIEHAGTRADQQLWSEACARALDDRRAPLIDFGFIGRDRRFEARRLTPPPPKAGAIAGGDRRCARVARHDRPSLGEDSLSNKRGS